MDLQPVNLSEKLRLFSEHWSPKVVARMNDYYFKLAKVQGPFVWHQHPETDEAFLVLKGQLEIQFREGEMFVVPKSLEHRPFAAEECHILLIEPAGTINTGNVVNEMTVAQDVWM